MQQRLVLCLSAVMSLTKQPRDLTRLALANAQDPHLFLVPVMLAPHDTSSGTQILNGPPPTIVTAHAQTVRESTLGVPEPQPGHEAEMIS